MNTINSNVLLAQINKEYRAKAVRDKLLDGIVYLSGLIIGLSIGYYIGLKPIVLACSVILKWMLDKV